MQLLLGNFATVIGLSLLHDAHSTGPPHDICSGSNPTNSTHTMAQHTPHNTAFAEHIQVHPYAGTPSMALAPTTHPAAGIRIMCIVYTHRARREALHSIVSTWAPRCDGFMAASDETDPSLSAVLISHHGPESYSNMWQKVRSMWAYTHHHHADAFDFFYVCGDDNFVVVDNLRHLLSSPALLGLKNTTWLDMSNTPLHVGQSFRGYILGTGGYVLNRAALTLFVTNMHERPCSPHKTVSSEDIQITRCLRALGGTTVDVQRRFGRFSPTLFCTAKIARRVGTKCCERDLVSLHYMQPWEIIWMYRSLYCKV